MRFCSRCRLLEYTIITAKPAFVATCIKQETSVTQVCIPFLQKANTLKRSCINQVPVLSECNFDYHFNSCFLNIGWTVPVSLYCRPWKYNGLHFYQVDKDLGSW